MITIISTLITAVATILCAIVAAGAKRRDKLLEAQSKRQTDADARQRAVEGGIQALLRDRILTAYYHYHDWGWISYHGLEVVIKMYDEYHNLGGNGAITDLVEVMRDLEVRDG